MNNIVKQTWFSCPSIKGTPNLRSTIHSYNNRPMVAVLEGAEDKKGEVGS